MKNKIKDILNRGSKIKRLTALWYKYVGMDHHKDKDCKWYIMEAWEYGDYPYYYIEHDGYIYQNKNIKNYDTREAVEKALIAEIRKVFRQGLKWANYVVKHKSEYDAIQVDRATWLIENYKDK